MPGHWRTGSVPLQVCPDVACSTSNVAGVRPFPPSTSNAAAAPSSAKRGSSSLALASSATELREDSRKDHRDPREDRADSRIGLAVEVRAGLRIVGCGELVSSAGGRAGTAVGRCAGSNALCACHVQLARPFSCSVVGCTKLGREVERGAPGLCPTLGSGRDPRPRPEAHRLRPPVGAARAWCRRGAYGRLRFNNTRRLRFQ